MRSGGSTWLLPARSFFIGCGAGLAAAAWNPTNVCPRLLCPLRSIVATLALPSCRHSCRSARVLRGHFGGPFCERACCLDSCLDKSTSSNFKFSSSQVLLSRQLSRQPPPPPPPSMAWQVKKAACGWVLMCCRVAGVHRCDANDLTPEIPISCGPTANPSSAAVLVLPCSR